MEAVWRIELLGGPRVRYGDRVITRFPTQKTASLLAYLAYYRQHPQPRDVLVEQLWPEIAPEAARASLRTALHSLRRVLEPADNLLIASRTTLSLNATAFITDVAEFRAALEAAQGSRPTEWPKRLAAAVDLYRGELLPGYYETWILTERQHLQEIYLDALHRLVTALEEVGELERALQVARRSVAADPLREEAHYDLMRLYAAAGQPSAVLRQYHELERLLREQLGDTPSEPARALAEELRQRAHQVAHHRAAGSGSSSRVSPAVEPLDPPPPDPPITEALLPSRPSFYRDLPVSLTRFIGRARELAEVQELLTSTRLLTLTGAGGCGKTFNSRPEDGPRSRR